MTASPARPQLSSSPHVLDAFDQEPEESDPIPGQRALLVSSAGVLAGIVLGCVAFVSGLVWAVAHEPNLDYQNVFAELGIKIAFALVVGAFCALVVVALGLAAVGVLWIRGRVRDGKSRPDEQPTP